MNLIEHMMTPCVLIDKIRTDDGEGGFFVSYKDGARFEAAVICDTSMTARKAEADGVTNIYTVTTKRSVALEYHDLFRRLSDGRVFRVTNDSSDKVSPNVGTLDIRQCSAERWALE